MRWTVAAWPGGAFTWAGACGVVGGGETGGGFSFKGGEAGVVAMRGGQRREAQLWRSKDRTNSADEQCGGERSDLVIVGVVARDCRDGRLGKDVLCYLCHPLLLLFLDLVVG